ncbi:MAG TPA: helix-hairpin-helix domain-containing protein [Bacteroidales bacterium]|nr:helix-hairpin-helix domain-containing protein [Bacteroidales bacterium]
MLGIGIHVSKSQELQSIADALFRVTNQEYDAQTMEFLQEALHNKIDINTIEISELSQFGFLTEFEQKSIIAFVEQNKPLKTIYELQLVLGLPIEKAQLLSHFCVVPSHQRYESIDELLKQGTHTLSSAFQFPIGNELNDSTNTFEGSMLKHSWRYRFQSDNMLLWGLTCKKDVGEVVSKTNPNMYDYTSAYVQYKPQGIVSNFILGDYELQIAQGLMQWQGGYFGKQIRTQHMSNHYTLKKHSSGNEIDFYRGAAATMSYKSLHITPFVSCKNIDGKFNDDSSQLQLYTTGYHRTAQEIEYAKSIQHGTQGIHIQYTIASHTLSAAYMRHIYTRAAFQSAQQFTTVAYSFSKKHTSLFTELATNYKALAYCVGLQSTIARDITALSMFRYYQPQYTNDFAQSISEQSSIGNEQGVFTVLTCPLSTHVTLHCIHDYYYMPQPRYFVAAPTRGNELCLRLQYSNWNGVRMYYAWSNGYKTQNSTNELQHKEIFTEISQFHKLFASLPVDDRFVFKTCIAYTKNTTNKGVLIYQDIVYKPNKTWNMCMRYAQFSAPYNTRIFAWEDNTEYNLQSHQYYNQGSHWYALGEWNLAKCIRIECKLSHTAFSKIFTQTETPTQLLLGSASIRVRL